MKVFRILCISLLAWVGCVVTAWAAPFSLLVSTRPLAATVTGILPTDELRIDTLLEAGVTPHDAQLRPRQVMALTGADLVVWWGPDVEPYLVPWLKKRNGPVLDLSILEGLTRLPVRVGIDPHKEHAGDHDEDAHGAPFDIHLWWSRNNLQRAQAAILSAMIQQRQDWGAMLAAGEPARKAAWQQLDALVSQVRSVAPQYVVFHDGWQYLEHDIGVTPAGRFVAHDELGTGVKHLAALKARFADMPPRCVIVEPGMNTAVIDKLLPGVTRIALDPLGWDVPQADATALLRHAYEALLVCGH